MVTTEGPDSHPPAAWHADPTGRHQFRFWDGSRWTDQVSDDGATATDPMDAATSDDALGGFTGIELNDGAHDPARVRRQVSEQTGIVDGATGGGTILTEPVLVVNQKAKLVEVASEYAIYDREGNRLGSVREVGQSTAKKLLRVVSSLDQFMTHTLEIRDREGHVVLKVTRPRKVIKSTVMVTSRDGRELGRVVQRNMIGKIRFGLEAGGEEIGSINAENWRAWNFNIQDSSGAEVARVTKTWEGLAKAVFTTADNYVVQLHRDLEEPLRSLVVASALSIDTALKQDSGGLLH